MVLALLSGGAGAEVVVVAVAANFRAPLTGLLDAFRREHAAEVRVVSGSTGKLYAQIVAGAPFDLFLAADQARPARLEGAGFAVAGSRVTYALGQVVLWDPRGGEVGPARLRAGNERLALANPALAPYGEAAMQVLAGLDVGGAALRGRTVVGENVAQAFAFAATGNADLAFVALAQVLALPAGRRGSHWQPPQALYAPVRQDMVLLARAARNDDARALHAYLQTAAVRARLRAAGYALPPAADPEPDPEPEPAPAEASSGAGSRSSQAAAKTRSTVSARMQSKAPPQVGWRRHGAQASPSYRTRPGVGAVRR